MTVVMRYSRPEEQTCQGGDRWHRLSIIMSDDLDLDEDSHESSHMDDQDIGYVYETSPRLRVGMFLISHTVENSRRPTRTRQQFDETVRTKIQGVGCISSAQFRKSKYATIAHLVSVKTSLETISGSA